MEEQINSVIDHLAEKLGVAASEIFSILEAQATTEAAKSAFSIFNGLAVIFICYVYIHKVFIKKDANGDAIIDKVDFDGTGLLLCILAIIAIFFSFYMLICINGNIIDIIQCMMNPRYWALEKIFDLIRESA